MAPYQAVGGAPVFLSVGTITPCRSALNLRSVRADLYMADTLAQIAALLAASIAFGATPKTEVERLEDLIAEALRANPEVQMAERLYLAASQKPARESALPDPKLSIGYQSVGRPYQPVDKGRS